MDVTRLTAEFVSRTRWQDLPPAVQEKSRFCFIDNLGATISGNLTRYSRICADYAAVTWPGDNATILGHNKTASAVGAAFANGAAANGLDTDDSARYAWGHAGAEIFPTVLAVAESRQLSGERLLAAMVVAYEVAHRVGRAWHADRETYQACGSWGAPTCAAGAANLMDLTPDQTWHALGIADYHAPNLPMMRDIDHPAMVKHGIHWACMTGVTAAELAVRGFTGIPLLIGDERFRHWGEDIGREYLILDGISWKSKGIACCGWAHAAVVAAQQVVHEHQINLDQIAAIRVDTFAEGMRLGTQLPQSTEAAQFNMAWPIAAMLVDGEVGPRQTVESRLSDPAIRSLASIVELSECEDLNELCRLHAQGDPKGAFAGRVSIELDDGRAFESGTVDSGLRFPPPPWNREKMAEKFRWLVAERLGQSRTEEVLAMAWQFEDVNDLGDLIRLVDTKP